MTAQRILIVAPSWVGDLVMADTLLKILRQQAPRAPIDVLAPAWALPVAARMQEVDELIELPAGHGELALGARWHLARRLRERGYSHAYILPRSAKSAWVPWLARIPDRIGYRGEWRYGLINRIRRLNPSHRRLIARYAALAYPPGTDLPDPLPRPALRSDPGQRRHLLQTLGLDARTAPFILCPGAEYGPAKRWPAEHFAELAKQLRTEGHEVWIVGSAGERELGELIGSAAPGAVNLTGKTTLEAAIDVMASAQAVITNDSGLMHVAAALERPLVALYGSSMPAYTPPSAERVRIIYHALECSPCFARECPLGHFRCLRGIEPGEVRAALTDLART